VIAAQAGDGPGEARTGSSMRSWDPQRVADSAAATLVRVPSATAGEGGPGGVSIDSRTVAPGDLFIGLRGERADGGEHAAQALAAGAWGVLVAPAHAQALAREGAGGVLLAHAEPLEGLQRLARAWRRELAAGGTKVVAITGSTGKTSTKDILAALLGAQLRTFASPQNHNTEIGLPLALLAAPAGTEVLILEMAMRGAGQIAQLTAIAEPDVGLIVNVGPAHLEQLGSVEAIAAAKAELIAGLAPGASLVIPGDEPLLRSHLRSDLRTLSFGEDAEVTLLERHDDGGLLVRHGDLDITLHPSFRQEHNLRNLLAAVAVARALGLTPGGRVEVSFAAQRGERRTLPGGAVLIDDCYNANPMSMRAAIDDLAEVAPARRVAVLGDMLELGPDAPRLHIEVGEHAADRGVELLVAVGPLAAEMLRGFAGESHWAPDAAAAAELLAPLLRAGDTVLVKGSRGVGLERVAEILGAAREPGGDPAAQAAVLAPGGGPGRR
jgi:UDP-N-acetylmuramoyl-tripeptide--D-alanyl-D-alanine ligase